MRVKPYDSSFSESPLSMTSTDLQLPTPLTHPLAFRLATTLGQTIAIFDLETTDQDPRSDTFGLTAFAYYALKPDGTCFPYHILLNPECSLSPESLRLTGLTQDQITQSSPFSAQAKRIRRMFENTILSGFNIKNFGIPSLLGQFKRFGLEQPSTWQSFDLLDIYHLAQPSSTDQDSFGTVTRQYGKPFEGAARTPAHTLACVDLLESQLWQHGLDAVQAVLNPRNDFTLSSEKKQPLPSDLPSTDQPLATESQPAPAVAPAPLVAPAVSTETAPVSSESPKPKTLTPAQAELTALLQTLLPQKLDISVFATQLAASGFRLEVTKSGAAYIKNQERIHASDLGPDYAWSRTLSSLSGNLTPELVVFPIYAPNLQRFQPSAPHHSAPSAAPHMKPEEALLAIFSETGKMGPNELKLAFKRSGIQNFSNITFALGTLLSTKQIPYELAVDPTAQQWIDQHWTQLPTTGALKPLLASAKQLGAPDLVDYNQLRVAVALHKMADKVKNASPVPSGSPPAATGFKPAGFSEPCPDFGVPSSELPSDASQSMPAQMDFPFNAEPEFGHASLEMPPFDDDDMPFDSLPPVASIQRPKP